jgi:hypothetical protein
MTMRTNSPIDDSSEKLLDETPPVSKTPANDWEKLGKSGKYKQINAYMEVRKAYYQSFLPGNVPISQIPDEERAKYWQVADLVITELKNLQAQIALHSGKPLE